MRHTILVPLDGSALAERALGYARFIAQSSGSKLIVLEVVPPRESAAAEQGGPVGEDGIRLAKEYLENLVVGGRIPADTERLVLDGDPTEVILETVRSVKADLVVMSTHGRSGVGRWLYGSVADAVMRRSPIPVLVLPPGVAPSAPSDRAPRILVPLDGSELALRALPPAEALAADLDAELILLRVVLPDVLATSHAEAWGMVDPALLQAGAQADLNQVAESVRSKARAVRTRVAFGLPIATIDAIARERDVSLIALSTHGSGGLKRAVMGSVAAGLVRYADRPVLVVGPEVALPASTRISKATAPVPQPPAAPGDLPAPKVDHSDASLKALGCALASGPIEVREAAARTLGSLGGDAAAALLVRAMRRGPGPLRHAVTRSLIQIGPASVPALLELLDDPDEAVRVHAAEALALIGDPRCATALVMALDDSDPGVRWYAARGVARTGEDGLRALFHALAVQTLTPWLSQGATRVLRHVTEPRPKPASFQRLAEALTHSTASVEVPVRAGEAMRDLEARPEAVGASSS